MTEPKVNIIIMCQYDFKHTIECIKNIKKFTNYNNYDLSIFNNGNIKNNNDKINALKKSCNIKVIQHQKPKKIIDFINQDIYTFNEYDYICLINNGVQVSQNWLNKLIDDLQYNKKSVCTPVSNLHFKNIKFKSFNEMEKHMQINEANIDENNIFLNCMLLKVKEYDLKLVNGKILNFDDYFVSKKSLIYAKKPVNIQLTNINFNIVIFFHVFNLTVFDDILKTYSNFFTNKLFNFIFYCSTNTEEKKEHILHKIPNAIISICENRGADIGGFFSSLNSFFKDEHLNCDDYIYLVLHTKTDDTWRNNMIKNLLNSKNIMGLKRILNNNNNNPIIIGDEKYHFDSKLINVDNIKKTFYLYNDSFKNDINDYVDTYVWEDNDDGKKEYVDTILLRPEFYNYYERDLRSGNDAYLHKHWEGSGKNEFHRIQNPCLIKKPKNKYAAFIAGTCFVCNNSFIQFFKNINLELEITKMEPGYVVNNVSRMTHSWEYLFGLLCYLNDGYVLNINDNGNISDMKTYDDLDLCIYKNCNDDLKHLSNDKLVEHYKIHGYKEKRIYSLKTLTKKQVIINNHLNKAKIAIFLFIVPNNLSGGYRTLLRYINCLKKNGYDVDIYFGDNSHHLKTVYGYSIITNNLDDILKTIDSYNELNINDYNFFLGLNVVKKYDLIFANAWQIADSVYFNKQHAKKLGYIIQDLEALFYPKNKDLQQKVVSTYKNDYNYFCLSKYLYENFKHFPNTYYSNLSFDKKIYNINKPFETRTNSVIISYYPYKPNRQPKLCESIISILSKQKINCYVFPTDIKITNGNNNYIHNIGNQTTEQLNVLYNQHKIGIVFSSSNPSRLGFEMLASGLNVIEYEHESTNYDMPNNIFTKIKSDKNIIQIVKNLFNNHIECNDFLNSLVNEEQTFLEYTKKLL